MTDCCRPLCRTSRSEIGGCVKAGLDGVSCIMCSRDWVRPALDRSFGRKSPWASVVGSTSISGRLSVYCTSAGLLRVVRVCWEWCQTRFLSEDLILHEAVLSDSNTKEYGFHPWTMSLSKPAAKRLRNSCEGTSHLMPASLCRATTVLAAMHHACTAPTLECASRQPKCLHGFIVESCVAGYGQFLPGMSLVD